MEGYKTWKYLVMNHRLTNSLPRLFFIEASCISEAVCRIQTYCGTEYTIIDKYEPNITKILGYQEIL